jgi:hypothetical protein
LAVAACPEVRRRDGRRGRLTKKDAVNNPSLADLRMRLARLEELRPAYDDPEWVKTIENHKRLIAAVIHRELDYAERRLEEGGAVSAKGPQARQQKFDRRNKFIHNLLDRQIFQDPEKELENYMRTHHEDLVRIGGGKTGKRKRKDNRQAKWMTYETMMASFKRWLKKNGLTRPGGPASD